MSNQLQEVEVSDNILHGGQMMVLLPSRGLICITKYTLLYEFTHVNAIIV